MRRSALEASGPFDAVHSRTSIDFNLYFRLASRHDLVFVPDELTLIRRHRGADHLHSEADTRPLAMLAERSDAAAYLVRSGLASDESFRGWLSERMLHLSLRRSQMTSALGVDLSLADDEKLQLALGEIRRLGSAGDRVILVDQNEFGLKDAFGRQLLPFPEREGRYWGAPPDSDTAIAELQRMRKEGARFIAILWPAFWWLDYYHGFRDFLDRHFVRVAGNSRLIAFDLKIGPRAQST
jgi:hypothetical protein